MKKKLAVIGLCMVMLAAAAACGKRQETDMEARSRDISADLTFDHSMELSYAEEFAVDYYEEGYALITVARDGRYLLVPEGKELPSGLEPDITVLQQPLEHIYLSASAVMDMFVAADALDAIRFSSLKTDSWYIAEAREAMEREEILYAGSYAAPDYERILSEDCGLAIENTMIYHTPEVREQLEKFGIPVLVDYSSYEPEPLGRTEWVKLYGLLTGREEEAEEIFAEQMEAFSRVSGKEAPGKTVAFFYITTNGEANVRRASDYLPKMIRLAGGSYLPEHTEEKADTVSSTMTMQMEEFYASARDADYIIYNSAIEGELSAVKELTDKSSLLEHFRAVQEGHVFCTTKNLYQSSMELGTLIQDIHRMMAGEEDGLTYLYKLE